MLNIHGADLGRDQVTLVLRELRAQGKTTHFKLSEFPLGNPPKGMSFYRGEWTFRRTCGETVNMHCFIAVEQARDSWSLSEIYCREGP